MKILGLKDEFPPVGDEPLLHEYYGIDVKGIKKSVKEFWEKIK